MSDLLFSAAAGEKNPRLRQSDMLRRTLDFDWSATDAGPIADWPESLKSVARLVFSSSAPLALLIGPAGILIYNDAIRMIFEGIGASGLGRSVFDVLPDAADFYRDVIAACAAGEAPSFRDRILKIARNGTTEPAWFDLQFAPVIDSDGTHRAILVDAFETTEKIRTLHAHRRAEEQLRLALDASGMIGIWDFDLTTRLVVTDERFTKLFGIEHPPSSQGIPQPVFIERIHPDDRDRVASEIEAAIAAGAEFRSEYRVTDTAGKVHAVLASGHVIDDAAGNPVRFPGVAVDVTAQVEANAALVESEARFRALAEAIPQFVWISDADGRQDYFNSQWAEFTGLDPATADPAAWKDLVHPDDKERVFTVWNHSLETGEALEIEYRFRHHSGVYRWFLVRALPQRHADGRIARWFGTSTDIHERKLIAVEREIIAQELNHRIKNVFSVVGALVNLSVRSATDVKSYASDLSGRIMALSTAHDVVRPTSAHLPAARTLHSLVRQLLRPYADPRDARFAFQGEDIPLGEGAATSFALVFHELATNAAKYGALSVPDGHVVLRSGVEDGRMSAIWKESGVPCTADRAPSSGGFGSKLIALTVEGQMHGQARRQWEPDGLRLEISVPADVVMPADLR